MKQSKHLLSIIILVFNCGDNSIAMCSYRLNVFHQSTKGGLSRISVLFEAYSFWGKRTALSPSWLTDIIQLRNATSSECSQPGRWSCWHPGMLQLSPVEEMSRRRWKALQIQVRGVQITCWLLMNPQPSHAPKMTLIITAMIAEHG